MNISFIKWWIQFCLMCLAGFFVYYLDWADILWNNDQTKISMLIIGLFVVITLCIGWLTYQNKPNTSENNKIENYAWFSCNAMLVLGMIGTVTGFFIVLYGGFSGLDISDIQSVKDALKTVANGMGTALLTTLTGLVCSLLTHVQLIIYENRN